jgi:hypothetical protein
MARQNNMKTRQVENITGIGMRTCLDECSALRLSASLSAIAFCAARTAADTGRDCDDDNGSDEDEEDEAMVADEDGRDANDAEAV